MITRSNRAPQPPAARRNYTGVLTTLLAALMIMGLATACEPTGAAEGSSGVSSPVEESTDTPAESPTAPEPTEATAVAEQDAGIDSAVTAAQPPAGTA